MISKIINALKMVRWRSKGLSCFYIERKANILTFFSKLKKKKHYVRELLENKLR